MLLLLLALLRVCGILYRWEHWNGFRWENKKYKWKTKKLKFYENMENDGRKLMEYWNKLKDQIKLKRKERTEISKLFDVKLKNIDKAINDNNIESFCDLKNTSKGIMLKM